MTDNNGTRSRRPTPSKLAARTASAAATTPLIPANAAKSRTNAIACGSRPGIGRPDSVTSGLFIDRSLLRRTDGYRRDVMHTALPGVPNSPPLHQDSFKVSSINPERRPQASRLQDPGIPLGKPASLA